MSNAGSITAIPPPRGNKSQIHRETSGPPNELDSSMKDQIVVVTGGGGFIGGSLVAALRQQGFRRIRSVDIKPADEWYQRFEDVENLHLDLNEKENCDRAARGAY